MATPSSARAVEVGREALEQGRQRIAFVRRTTSAMAGAAVGDVVAVDRRDHDVVDAPRRDVLGGVRRLEQVERRRRARRLHVAEAAAARARVAHHHDRRRRRPLLAAPALADVRALGLLAHARQFRAAQPFADPVVLGAARLATRSQSGFGSVCFRRTRFSEAVESVSDASSLSASRSAASRAPRDDAAPRRVEKQREEEAARTRCRTAAMDVWSSRRGAAILPSRAEV